MTLSARLVRDKGVAAGVADADADADADRNADTAHGFRVCCDCASRRLSRYRDGGMRTLTEPEQEVGKSCGKQVGVGWVVCSAVLLLLLPPPLPTSTRQDSSVVINMTVA